MCVALVAASHTQASLRDDRPPPTYLQYLAAVVNNGYIFTSTNSGATWTQRIVGGGHQFWQSIASSSTGTVRHEAANTAIAPHTHHACLPYQKVARFVGLAFLASYSRLRAQRSTHSNLQNLAAVSNGGFIFTSTNSGVTWTARATDTGRSWRSIVSSSEGAVR